MSELQLILEKLEHIESRLDGCATKDDLKVCATKEDLKNFATKEDLKSFATKEDLMAFATKEEIETLEFVLREEYTTIYNIALENKKNIEELLKYRDLFYARSEEVSKIPMLEARLEVVEDAVREHTEEIHYLKQA